MAGKGRRVAPVVFPPRHHRVGELGAAGGGVVLLLAIFLLWRSSCRLLDTTKKRDKQNRQGGSSNVVDHCTQRGAYSVVEGTKQESIFCLDWRVPPIYALLPYFPDSPVAHSAH